MPTEAIPISNSQASGHDELGGAGVVSMNLVHEMTGAVRRRPGIRNLEADAPVFGGFDGPVTGVHATVGGDIYAVAESGIERTIYRVGGGSAAPLGGGASPFGLAGSGRPTFAETQMLLVIAGGAEPQKIELATASSTRLGGGPPRASHVVALASRLVANDIQLDPGTVRFSGIANGNTSFAGHEQWTFGIGTAGAITAEGRPDPVVALAENTNELFLFGSSSVQIFAPDPSGFILASSREFGIGAPHSIVKSEENLFWLDHKRRFVLGDGRTYTIISDPIQRTLDSMSRVDDCFGYRVVTGPCDTVVWTFPSDGRTFIFQKGHGWGQWARWVGNWQQFNVTSHHLRSGDKTNIVGLEDGSIGQISLDAATDRGFDVNAYSRTGFLSHKTSARKHCRAVRLAFRRGETQSASGPQAWLRYRDRPGAWTASIPISLGKSGDTEPVVNLRSLGVYRERQWEFEFTSFENLVLLSATEEFTVLEN